jgi:hypothetical protein
MNCKKPRLHLSFTSKTKLMEQPNGKPPISRRSKAQILELLSEFDKNHGMTVKAFCQYHKVTEASFYTARKRYRSSGSSQQKQSGFISIPSLAFKGSAGILFAEVNGIKLYQAVPVEYLKALIV